MQATPTAPTAATAPKVSPILAEHLPEVGAFLHEHLNRRFSPERWVQSVTHRWAAEVPNYGTQLRDGDRLVGVFLAIYSDQTIDGRLERFCNPHSWCVLESHRRYAINLALQIIRQPGYHFTMFTPNARVTEAFRGLKFKDLDGRQLVFPNLPTWKSWCPDCFAEGAEQVAQRLTDTARDEYEAHRSIPWLRFAAFGRGNDSCLAIFKHAYWKRLPCAWIVHVSNPAAFVRHGALLRHHLLMRHGYPTMRIEERWLPPGRRGFAMRTQRVQPKLYLSKSLRDADIRDVYSELMALDV